MTIAFTDNVKGNPAGKLADAELHFNGGPLDGLALAPAKQHRRRLYPVRVTICRRCGLPYVKLGRDSACPDCHR